MRLTQNAERLYVLDNDAADENVVRATYLIDEFLMYLKENGVANELIDELELPKPKGILVEAFRIAIAAERDPQMRSLLVKAALALAKFRPGLGNRVRLVAVTPEGRPEKCRSRSFERRIKQVLIATATDHLRLTDLFQRAVVQSLN